MKDKLISVIAFFILFWIILKIFVTYWESLMPWPLVSDLWNLLLILFLLVPLASILARLFVNTIRR
ncbi:hypothetical protein BN988_03327 [Oceanobacillus picturae]|uniref:Uncharacterized protein n=1 Tax=Oceanobacillus picturae TaxID=171693 RepID=W9BES1_9BACI|nr:hypothetical protein BN988_03327 [Oceanobacillus picturae]